MDLPTPQELEAIQLAWQRSHPGESGGPSPDEAAVILREIRIRQSDAEVHAIQMLSAGTKNPRSMGGNWSRWGRLWMVLIVVLIIALCFISSCTGQPHL